MGTDARERRNRVSMPQDRTKGYRDNPPEAQLAQILTMKAFPPIIARSWLNPNPAQSTVPLLAAASITPLQQLGGLAPFTSFYSIWQPSLLTSCAGQAWGSRVCSQPRIQMSPGSTGGFFTVHMPW